MSNGLVYSHNFFLAVILQYIQDYMKKSGGLNRYTLPKVTRQSLVCCRLCSALDAIANDGSRNYNFKAFETRNSNVFGMSRMLKSSRTLSTR